VDLEEANKRLADNLEELRRSRAISARTLASYQNRALQMEIIRQQNEDLDRLATELAVAKRNEEERAREAEAAARLRASSSPTSATKSARPSMASSATATCSCARRAAGSPRTAAATERGEEERADAAGAHQ
jgi:hypothetical protein